MDNVLCVQPTVAAAAPKAMAHVSGFVRTVDGILSPDECTRIIEIAERTGFGAASFFTDASGVEHYSDIRKSKRIIIDSLPFVDELWKRIQHAVPSTWNGRLLHAAKPINERLRILKYDTPGDEFKPHSDGQYVSPDGSISELTVLLYLNDEYTGAFTHFLSDDGSTFLPVTPTIGGMAIQDQRLVHCVPPLVHGVKYAIRTEIMYTTIV